MSAPLSSDFLLAEARARDPGRTLCILLGTRQGREPLLALLLFESELARVPRLVTQPMAGFIRYQWWRDGILEIAAGRERPEPILQALKPALAGRRLAPDALLALVDAHEAVLEAEAMPDTVPDVEHAARDTSGALHRLMAMAQGVGEERWLDAAQAVGTALGMLRAWPRLEAEVRPLEAVVRERARALVAAARRQGRVPRAALPAMLPARLVDAALRRPLAEPEPTRPALRLMVAGWTRRC